MTKLKIYGLIFVSFLILICSSYIWAIRSPTVDDLTRLKQRNTKSELAIAFVIALRLNHSDAYEIIGSDLSPKLDEWMNSHQAQSCIKTAHNISTGPSSSDGISVFYSCETAVYTWYSIRVDDVVIEDMKIIGWGRIEEDLN